MKSLNNDEIINTYYNLREGEFLNTLINDLRGIHNHEKKVGISMLILYYLKKDFLYLNKWVYGNISTVDFLKKEQLNQYYDHEDNPFNGVIGLDYNKQDLVYLDNIRKYLLNKAEQHNKPNGEEGSFTKCLADNDEMALAVYDLSESFGRFQKNM